ncbi:DsbA family oxidoreductase [Peptostreptococcus equinus]|uniref:DsbA family protein n=1 Tax=Peptostreptococcus equinus TaxID=3003601 RepID=A0ABY7JSU8_9FIRM|nr:DsbA family protein [Peptostreptococcus sp. CBA3647]WAW15539.1 DsbA family protein [Peptostreptococcus sp. CBA3647]
MKIEFFHDVICSYCFPMSARMRKIAERYENIEIIHRSFALAWKDEDYIRQFGSREAVKDKVVSHWHLANENDDEHRMNIEQMKDADFNFPLSRSALIACESARKVGGEIAYWNAFDSIQNKLFVESKNIESDKVLEEAIINAGIDKDKWIKFYKSPSTERDVLKDMELSDKYNINVVPTLIINGDVILAGAQSEIIIENVIKDMLK